MPPIRSNTSLMLTTCVFRDMRSAPGNGCFCSPLSSSAVWAHCSAPASERTPSTFTTPWSEQDHLTMELPAGFTLDNADVPAPIPREMTQNICEQKTRMAVTTDGRSLIYDRSFFFGGGGGIIFPA